MKKKSTPTTQNNLQFDAIRFNKKLWRTNEIPSQNNLAIPSSSKTKWWRRNQLLSQNNLACIGCSSKVKYIYEEENNSYSKSTNLQSEAAAATQTMKKADVGAKQTVKGKSTPMARQPCNRMQQQQRSKWWRSTQLLSQNNLAKFESATAKAKRWSWEMKSYHKNILANSILQQSKAKQNKTKIHDEKEIKSCHQIFIKKNNNKNNLAIFILQQQSKFTTKTEIQ